MITFSRVNMRSIFAKESKFNSDTVVKQINVQHFTAHANINFLYIEARDMPYQYVVVSCLYFYNSRRLPVEDGVECGSRTMVCVEFSTKNH